MSVCIYLIILGIVGEIFEAIEDDNGLHPAMKAVVVIKNLLLHAACGNPAEGKKMRSIYLVIILLI